MPERAFQGRMSLKLTGRDVPGGFFWLEHEVWGRNEAISSSDWVVFGEPRASLHLLSWNESLTRCPTQLLTKPRLKPPALGFAPGLGAPKPRMPRGHISGEGQGWLSALL